MFFFVFFWHGHHGDECQGFSIENNTPPSTPTKGCVKKNVDGGIERSTINDGHSKSSSPATRKCEQDSVAATVFTAYKCEQDSVAATAFTAYQSHVIIVLASWCEAAVTVRFDIDWEMLGFATPPHLVAPKISSWQEAADFGHGGVCHSTWRV